MTLDRVLRKAKAVRVRKATESCVLHQAPSPVLPYFIRTVTRQWWKFIDITGLWLARPRKLTQSSLTTVTVVVQGARELGIRRKQVFSTSLGRVLPLMSMLLLLVAVLCADLELLLWPLYRRVLYGPLISICPYGLTSVMVIRLRCSR